MLAHVVLFSPKASLSAEDRTAFVVTLERALAGIPQIARSRIGRRLVSQRGYEQLGPVYEYVAMLEFESQEALQQYLDHPAHQALGHAFYATLDRGLASDFELVDDVRALLT